MSRFALFLPVSLLFAAPARAEWPAPVGRLASQSASFRVRSFGNGPSAADLAARCERLRGEIRKLWLGDGDQDDAWRPRCEVVVHPSRGSYLQAVGRGGGQTSGSSLVRFEKDRVLARRIDLLVGAEGELSALAHELTHVVLADRFGRRPPRWVDEGIATMADSAEKRRLHHRDCREALRDGTALRLAEVLRLERFTSPHQVPAFYGQSLSLVRYLAEQDGPGRIVEFAEAAMETGYDRALEKFYDIDGVAALERGWRPFAASYRPAHASPAGHR